MSFWVKFNNQPAPPKVGVTAQESNTYTDFCLINVGGVTAEGHDASNELSYLILDVIEEMRLLQPSSMVQISKNARSAFETGFENNQNRLWATVVVQHRCHHSGDGASG